MGYVEEKGIRKGMIEGREKGRAEGELSIIVLYNWLKESGRDAETIMKAEIETLRADLYAEYSEAQKGIWVLEICYSSHLRCKL